MTAENTVGLIVAVALLGHLVRALLHPHNGSAFAGRAADTAHISPAYAELQSAGSPPATTWTPNGWPSWSRTTPRDGPWASSESPG